MNMESLFRFFNQYHEISNASQNALLEVIHETNVAKNELLQKIGVTCKTIYFINKGLARIYYFKDGDKKFMSF